MLIIDINKEVFLNHKDLLYFFLFHNIRYYGEPRYNEIAKAIVNWINANTKNN